MGGMVTDTETETEVASQEAPAADRALGGVLRAAIAKTRFEKTREELELIARVWCWQNAPVSGICRLEFVELIEDGFRFAKVETATGGVMTKHDHQFTDADLRLLDGVADARLEPEADKARATAALDHGVMFVEEVRSMIAELDAAVDLCEHRGWDQMRPFAFFPPPPGLVFYVAIAIREAREEAGSATPEAEGDR